MGILDIFSGFAGGKVFTRDSKVAQETAAVVAPGAPGEKRMLSVSRQRQAVNMGAGYDLLIDGVKVTKIGNGGSFMTEIPQECEVIIRCSSLHFKQMKLRIRAGEHPRIDFSTVYGGGVRVRVNDVQILEANGKKMT